jgi:hypothetical protein
MGEAARRADEELSNSATANQTPKLLARQLHIHHVNLLVASFCKTGLLSAGRLTQFSKAFQSRAGMETMSRCIKRVSVVNRSEALKRVMGTEVDDEERAIRRRIAHEEYLGKSG